MFDPTNESRGDFTPWEMNRWSSGHGHWPVSQTTTMKSNAWKMDKDRDRSTLLFHITRGYPTPPERIDQCRCIAQRNARELAEHLGYDDYRDAPWPTTLGTTYIPRPNHRDPDASLHVDLLPDSSTGKAGALPPGETVHVVDPEPGLPAPVPPHGQEGDQAA